MNLIHTPTEAQYLKVRDALAEGLAAAFKVAPPGWMVNQLSQLACARMAAHRRAVEVPGGEDDE